MMEHHKEPHGAHSRACHLILVVKCHQPVFLKERGIIEAMKTKVMELSMNLEVKVLEMECGIDHVHLLISAKPVLDIPKYINTIKGHSSRFLRKHHTDFLQNKAWGAHSWSSSYFIASTGNASIEVLKRHVENQRRRVALEH